MYLEYMGKYFKLKKLSDYKYLPCEELNKFKWNIIKNLYEYLNNNNTLKLYNNLTDLTLKQQNDIIIKSIIYPKIYNKIYIEENELF